jgi:hypothetical protein
MNSAHEAKENSAAIDGKMTKEEALFYRDKLLAIIDPKNFKCASCGYCGPCPQKIDIAEVMKQYNYYTVLGMEGAKERLNGWANWHDGYKIENCNECGACTAKCPNKLDVVSELKKIMALRG